MSAPILRFSAFAQLLCLAWLALSVSCSSDSPDSQGSGGMGGSSDGSPTSGGTSRGASASTGGTATGGVSVTDGASTSGTSTVAGAASTATGGAGTGGAAATGGASSSSASTSTGASSAGGTGGVSTGDTTTTTATDDGSTSGTSSTGGETGGTFTLTSPSWVDMAGCAPDMSASCGDLPTEITRSGAGTSPELNWTGAPAGTASFAVVLQDLSIDSTHWVIWNIAPTATGLPANIDQTTATPATPAGSQQCGKGTDPGYIGPGAPCNVYEFTVYALSVASYSPTSPTDPAAVRTQLNALNSTTLLGTATLRGRTNMTCN